MVCSHSGTYITQSRDADVLRIDAFVFRHYEEMAVRTCFCRIWGGLVSHRMDHNMNLDLYIETKIYVRVAAWIKHYAKTLRDHLGKVPFLLLNCSSDWLEGLIYY